jgi:hypothetical protein
MVSRSWRISAAIRLLPKSTRVTKIGSGAYIQYEYVQTLLESCSSIKAKRLFLYFADTYNMPWFQKLDIKNIDLGKGKRQVAANGILNKKYQITVPDEIKSISLTDIP